MLLELATGFAMLPNGRCACQSKEAERPTKDFRAPRGCAADEGCCAIAGVVRPAPVAALTWILTYPPAIFCKRCV